MIGPTNRQSRIRGLTPRMSAIRRTVPHSVFAATRDGVAAKNVQGSFLPRRGPARHRGCGHRWPEPRTAILDYLYDHVRSPEFQVRLRWNKGDVVFWDNRVVQHYAVPDYNERRLIHRISILPYSDSGRPLAEAAHATA